MQGLLDSGENGKKTTNNAKIDKPKPTETQIDVVDTPMMGDSVTYTPKEIAELDWEVPNE